MTKLLNNKIFRGSILGLMILCMVVVAVFLVSIPLEESAVVLGNFV